jgi:long-chain acyl-CoA synthetase
MRTLGNRRSRQAVPAAGATGETILAIFRDNAALLADRPALRHHAGDEWQVTSWRAYGQAVDEVAAGLADLGVAPGDRVAILSGNRLEWHLADLGGLAAGAVTVPIYATNASSQVAYVLGHAGAKVCFVEGIDQLAKVLLRRDALPDLQRIVLFDNGEGLDHEMVMALSDLRAAGARRLAREPDLVERSAGAVTADDLATLVYTSGTTGPPKGTMITHGNIMATLRSLTSVIALTPRDRFLSFLPLSHITERSISQFGHVVSGGETWFARSFTTVAEDLKACRPTIFFGVPRVWEKFRERITEVLAETRGPKRAAAERYLTLGAAVVAAREGTGAVSVGQRIRYALLDRLVGAKVRHGLGLDQVRLVASGAAPIHPDLLRWFHAIGLPIVEGYGQTEVALCTSLNPIDANRIGSVGRPIPGVSVRIAEDGEILVRGDNVCAGYYRNEAASAELVDHEGWLRSGDLGSMDDEGYLFITGRKKDLIITAHGKNIAPQEIETRLRYEPLISQAVVVGDGRPYLTALLTLDAEAVGEWAAREGKLGDLEALCDDPDLLAEVRTSVDRVNAEHARAEGIKRWKVLPHDFTIAAGELTPTLKVRRQAVSEHHADVIEELYAGSA